MPESYAAKVDEALHLLTVAVGAEDWRLMHFVYEMVEDDVLSATQKESIEAYMASEYSNWGIGVGRVMNRMVLVDRLVVEH